MAKTEIMMARRPAKVQKTAIVWGKVRTRGRLWGLGQAHIKHGQPPVSKGRHSVAQQGDAKEDEVGLIRGSLEDSRAICLFKHIDTSDEEQGGTEVHRERNGNVTDEIQPAADPAGNATPAGGGQHERLVVDT